MRAGVRIPAGCKKTKMYFYVFFFFSSRIERERGFAKFDGNRRAVGMLNPLRDKTMRIMSMKACLSRGRGGGGKTCVTTACPEGCKVKVMVEKTRNKQQTTTTAARGATCSRRCTCHVVCSSVLCSGVPIGFIPGGSTYAMAARTCVLFTFTFRVVSKKPLLV